MTPTAKLRFVLRDEQTGMYGSIPVIKTVRILQQWWEPEQNIIDMVAGKTKGEWRDIPLEAEDFTSKQTSG
jgi:hypothetical protein